MTRNVPPLVTSTAASKSPVRLLRGATLGAVTASALIISAGCLDRPLAPAVPKTNNVLSDSVKETSVDKIDILVMIDNSASMADKQEVLGKAIPDLVNRLVSPSCGTSDKAGKFTPDANQPAAGADCPSGEAREFTAITDIHIGVVTSSLGDHGSDTCHFNTASALGAANNITTNDHAQLVTRPPRANTTDFTFNAPAVPTYVDATGASDGFLAWDPTGKKNTPPGESDVGDAIMGTGLVGHFASIVRGADQAGCGYEAQMEAWYRFLIDPSPPASVDHERGTHAKFDQPVTLSDANDETLLAQRADFLRPDSLVAIISLSDENDCSVIDGSLPADVCETPTLDKTTGAPTGCAGDRTPWPAEYATQLNFNNGQPFGYNWLVTQLLVPDNVPYNTQQSSQSYVHMLPGTTACDTDWSSPDCQSCLLVGTADPKCATALTPATSPSDDDDPLLLRLWETKRRFGVDFLYPLQRYIAGLTQAQVYDRNGFKVQNPLFDDLQFKTGKTKTKIGQRPANLIFYAAIAGVPWQDIARDPKDLKAGYKPAITSASAADDVGLDGPVKDDTGAVVMGTDGKPLVGWDLILGDPFNPNAKQADGTPANWVFGATSVRRDPVDPLMKETNKPRFGMGKPPLKHPVLTKTMLGDTTNPINGNDYLPVKNGVPGSTAQDLEYACIFPLTTPKDCNTIGLMNKLPCDCSDWDASSNNPLCADPNGKFGLTQYRAKAYPGTRYLHVLKGIGGQAIVASICAANTSDDTQADFGYRPAVAAIIERLKTQLSGKCLPRKLQPDPDSGTTPCLIIDAEFLTPDKTNMAPAVDPNAVKECLKCNTPGREPLFVKGVHEVDKSSLSGDVTKYECLCAVSQLGQQHLRTDVKVSAADDKANLTSCKQQDPAVLVSGTTGGWCYVDETDPLSNPDLVSKCPSTEKQQIRFVQAATDNANLFITCLGAASGQESSGSGGAGGTSGSAGSAGK